MLVNQLTQQSWLAFELQHQLVCITPCYAVFLPGIIQLVFANQDIVNQRYLLVEREGVSKLALRRLRIVSFVVSALSSLVLFVPVP